MRTKKLKDAIPTTNRKRVLRVEIAPVTILIAVLAMAGIWLLVQLLPVMMVLIAALMIVGTLNPAVEWLEERKIRRGVAIAIIFSAVLLTIVLPLILMIPALFDQVTSLVQQEPELRAAAVGFLSRYPLTASIAVYLRDFQYNELIKSYGAQALAFSTRIIEILAYSAAALSLSLYIMIDRARLRGAVFAAVPRSHHIRLSRILTNLETIVGGYLRGQVLTCLMMGLFLFILLVACGIPNALALAVFGGIADVLPFVGLFMTMVPVVLVALAEGPVITVIVLVALLCYGQFENRILFPVVYGRALRLPSSVVFFSLLTGGILYGIAGALLALPIAATIFMLIDELRVELPGEQAQAGSVELKERDMYNETEYERRTEGMPAEEASAIALEITDQRKHEENNPGSNLQDKSIEVL